MTKVLSLKRPKLIPIIDRNVLGFLFRDEWPRTGRQCVSDVGAARVLAMKQFRGLMLFGENLARLRAIAAELNPWMAGLSVSTRRAPRLSNARVLDCLLWYDWDGHRHFGSDTIGDGLSITDLLARLDDPTMRFAGVQ